ncbi:LysR family transcriptional regulator [Nitratireductor sp. XY-223]|uniref:LysR family transcriptional regulator n=1 Tax=Nitratireductor sp. XY-223 TaxID=2561926 RepID=UPI0010AA87F0|nr:LysR family transcriptional regulator [Nitratireductor sp. XY-223]
MDQIEAMRAFVAVAKENSFTGAAGRLGKSTKLVSNHVAALERRLAAQLFHRTTRSVTLTDLGTAYLERCRPLLDQFDELDDLVQDRHRALSGPIRITAPTGFGSAWLVQALAPFQTEHPAIEIDLHLTDKRVALVEEGFDLGVRIGILRDSTLRVRKLADMPLVVCAAPSYLETHGRPAHPQSLASHNCLINGDRQGPETWHFMREGEALSVRVTGNFTANMPAAVAAMAIGGLGIACSPRYAVEPALADGRLEALFEDSNAMDFGVYALYPPNRHLTARMRALIDHLAAYFGSRSSAWERRQS